MDFAKKVVSQLPLESLWSEKGPLIAERKNYLTRSEIRELLKKGPVQFVMAIHGDKLVWEDVAGCYAFFKQEGMDHIVDGFDHIYLDHFKDSYCYLAASARGSIYP
jgi:hypothetical protein